MLYKVTPNAPAAEALVEDLQQKQNQIVREMCAKDLITKVLVGLGTKRILKK